MSDVIARIALEKFVASLAIDRALDLGFSVSVNDGEETVLKRSKDKNAILEAMFSTDEDYLYFYATDNGPRLGWAYFIYGNSGYDVISDYSDNTTTDDILASALSVYDAYHAGKLEITYKFAA